MFDAFLHSCSLGSLPELNLKNKFKKIFLDCKKCLFLHLQKIGKMKLKQIGIISLCTKFAHKYWLPKKKFSFFHVLEPRWTIVPNLLHFRFGLKHKAPPPRTLYLPPPSYSIPPLPLAVFRDIAKALQYLCFMGI